MVVRAVWEFDDCQIELEGSMGGLPKATYSKPVSSHQLRTAFGRWYSEEFAATVE